MTDKESISDLISELIERRQSLFSPFFDSYARIVEICRFSDTAVNELIRYARGSDFDNRYAACCCLGRCGFKNPDVIDALIQCTRDADWRLSRVACDALGRIGANTPEVIAALLECTLRSDWFGTEYRLNRAAKIAIEKIKKLEAKNDQ